MTPEATLFSVALSGRWPIRTVRHAMPLLMWTWLDRATIDALVDEHEGVEKLLTSFFESLGPTTAGTELERRMFEHYAEHPVDPDLWRTVERTMGAT